jgi:hypothetical protein
MAKRIVFDMPIGVSERLLASITAWSRFYNQPRSEFCRNILERHIRRIGTFPPARPENPFEQPENPPVNSMAAE